MGKKLTTKEIHERIIEKAIKRIKSIANTYGGDITRSACQRYATREREGIKLQREIKVREEELANLKQRGR